jgi:hypothetical protein
MKKWFRIAKIVPDGTTHIIDSKSNWFEVEPNVETIESMVAYWEIVQDVVVITVWSKEE